MIELSPRLDPWTVLARYPALHRPIGAFEDLGGGGGLSGSRLWRFDSGRGRMLLRAWPSPGPSRAHLVRVHGWQAEAADLGWIPLPVAGLDGATLQEGAGRFWELVPWIDGEPDEPGRPSRARIAEGFRALASLHRRWERGVVVGRSPGLWDRLQELEALAARGFGSLGKAVEEAESDARAELGRRWLALAPAAVAPLRDRLRRALAVEVPRQPCLRDVRRDHILFQGDRVEGLVDFGAMGEESVAGDLARLLADWPGDHPALRQAAIDAYESIRPLQPAEHGLIPVFEASAGVLTGAHWLRWHYLEGRVFEDPDAVRAGLARGLVELRRAIDRLSADPGGGFRGTR